MDKFKNHLKLYVSSNRTVENYLERMNNFFSKFNAFNQDNVNQYFSWIIDNNKSASTFNASMTAFKKYAEYKEIFVKFPPSKKVERKIPTSLSIDEVEKEILPYFNMLFRDAEKRRLVFRFAMLSMLRISELINLKKEDVNLQTNSIQVRDGKGGKNRKTMLNKAIKDDFIKIMNQSPNEYALNVTPCYVRYIFTKINKTLNYKKPLTPHTLRHAGAKYLYQVCGIKQKPLKMLLGHTNLNTTDIYLDYEEDEVIDIYNNQANYKKG